MAMITINGAEMPEPSSVSVACQDIDSDSTVRNEAGIMQRDRVRQGVRKVTVKWPPLVSDDAAVILNAIKDASLKVTYPDPESASYQTKTMYASDRSCDVTGTAAGPRWNISFDLVEY